MSWRATREYCTSYFLRKHSISNEELDATFNCSVDPNLSLMRVAICLSCYQKRTEHDDAGYGSLIEIISRLQLLMLPK
jgi:hypothetical protein